MLFLAATVIPLAGQARTALEVWSRDSLVQPLYQVQSLGLVQDSILWVSDGGTGIHRLTTTGGYLGAVGREGEGPGEYRWPWLIQVLDDTIAVFDRRLLRLSLFSADGRFQRSTPMQVLDNIHGRFRGIARHPNGWLAWTDNYPAGSPRPNEQSSFVWLIGANGTPRDTLVKLPGPESVMLRETGTSSRIDAPFQRRPFVLFGGESIIIGNNGTDQLTTYNTSGQVISTRRIPLTAKRVTAADRTTYHNFRLKRWNDEVEQQNYGPEMRRVFAERFDQIMELVRYPSTWHRYELMLRDTEGDLWFLLPSHERARTWVELSASGRIKRRIKVPHKGTVLNAVIAGNMMYAGEWDEDEAKGRVAAYSVR